MRTYKVKFDADYQEYIVSFYIDGVKQKNADYFTSDKEDAHNTGKHWVANK